MSVISTSCDAACAVVYSCVESSMQSRQLIKLLTEDGWYEVHVVGSHHQFRHPSRPGKVTVPHPKKDLPFPTVRSILRQAGLTLKD